jgi:hypothetical protein
MITGRLPAEGPLRIGSVTLPAGVHIVRTRLTSPNRPYDQERKPPGTWNPAHPARQPGRRAEQPLKRPQAATSGHPAKITKDAG